MAAAPSNEPTRRRPTTTSNFGVSRRESHDASGFYGRFRPPELSTDSAVAPPQPVDEPFVCGDARRMTSVGDASVALVVTSPPYFAGKQYEEELGRDGVPASYIEYLAMLRDVFAECVRVLEPGGRIAVNVANLGRKPYRSLSADVIGLLQDDLGLLLRGEVIWQKAEGASGSCAWGSFRSAANPVLRDVTERVVIASKGRFDRALSTKQRAAAGLPSESTVGTDDFMALTLDVWSVPTESARRVGHPAPFPVELPERLIRLYTFADDLVLDPFMGSGSTLVAAATTGRRYVGYDLDPAYVALARERVAASVGGDGGHPDRFGAAPAGGEGRSSRAWAEDVLVDAGFAVVGRDRRLRGAGVSADLVVRGHDGTEWPVLVAGPASAHRPGLSRLSTVLEVLGRATVVHASTGGRVLVATPDAPRPGTDGDRAMRTAAASVGVDLVVLGDPGTPRALARRCQGSHGATPGV
ncbi:MAG: site-specific DNA-methyltransferase [Acidimicrobiales bacterium]|nr:site-specific DNA-methyltransferase [Acidimicrobiales bacterium]